MALAAVEADHMTLQFESHVVLREVSVKIEEGEVFVIVGPSGQGKSVLLKTLAGLVEPTLGSVRIRGKDWRDLSGTTRQKMLCKLGMLFQKNALFDSLSVGENIAFPLREVTALPEDEITQKVNLFLEVVGIFHAKDLFPDEISGGMQKRLGIARALALNPEIIFYDDPTAGLDPITSRKIVDLILSLKKKNNSTVIAVTNDMNRAYQMADRIAVVVDGEVIITGNAEQTKKHQDPRVFQFVRGDLHGPLTVQE